MNESKDFVAKLAFSEQTKSLIEHVTNKRARFVLDSIVRNGMVSTEEISKAGYDHPPRAAQDVRDLGFPLKTLKVKHSNGRSIAAYTLDVEKLQKYGMEGRASLSKKERERIIERDGGECRICSSTLNLQIDHCIPYQVGGESRSRDGHAFQVLCGSCNRKKSWACEHCPNFLETKSSDTCSSCYWSGFDSYTHVATIEERRVDLIWSGKDETEVADRLAHEAKSVGKKLPEHIKDILKD